MSIWKLVKLKFGRNVVHFGKLGIGLEEANERVQSDTLFSAWISSYARLFGKSEVEALLQRFQDPLHPPFRLSSTFIYQTYPDDEIIYYLPRPLQLPLNYPIGEDMAFAKAYKALSYLPLSIWQRWYQGEGFTPEDRQELTQGKDSPSHALTDAGAFAYKKAYSTEKLPKVAIDRITRATNFYYTGTVQYRYDPVHNESLSGLYFLVEFPQADEKLETEFSAVLEFLGEEGLGGERSSGAGQFTPEVITDLPDLLEQVLEDGKDSSNRQYSLLSLFWQYPLQTDLNNASYELQERGGWISSPSSDGRQLRRKTVQMFTEGSVFPVRPQGQLADVTPGDRFREHRVYRSGISLSLPIRAGEPQS